MFNISIGSDLDKESLSDEIALNSLGINQGDIKNKSSKKDSEIRKNNTLNGNLDINKKIYNKINQKLNVINQKKDDIDILELSPEINKETKSSRNIGHYLEKEEAAKSFSIYTMNNIENNQKYNPIYSKKNSLHLRGKENYSCKKSKSYKNWLIDKANNYNTVFIDTVAGSDNYLYSEIKKSNKTSHNNSNYFDNNNLKTLNYNENENLDIMEKVYHKKYSSNCQKSNKKNKTRNVDYSNVTENIYTDKNINIYNLEEKFINMRYPQSKKNISHMNNINTNKNLDILNNNTISSNINAKMNKNIIYNDNLRNSFNYYHYSNKLKTLNLNEQKFNKYIDNS